ncbi:MAG: hypothetical protein WB781_22390, partial [Candidatus Sulfotelmatobacter sp.]
MFSARAVRPGKSNRIIGSVIRNFILAAFASAAFFTQARAADTQLRNEALRVVISSADGSYTIYSGNSAAPVIRAGVGAEVDHRWIRSAEYPKHEVVDADFDDSLGHGRQETVTFSGLANQPDLIYTIRVYQKDPLGDIRLQVRNSSGRSVEVQSIRSVETLGNTILDLHGNPTADRVLSDSFSEDWPPLEIYDLGKAPNGMHLAVGSQTIYNQQSRQSVFFGALSADKFLTILH